MIGVADRHLAEVHAAFAHPQFAAQTRHPGTTAELARLTRVLSRYTDQIASGFGIPSGQSAGVRDAARSAGALLHQAREIFGERPWAELQGPTLAQNLRGISVSLGCGLDLLATHFRPATDQHERASTANATVIAATDTARALFRTISTHAAIAGQIALQAGPRNQQAGKLLLKAAAITGLISDDDTTGVGAIPLRHSPERLPPESPEDGAQALAGIDITVQRINAREPAGSVTTWRYLARAATVIHGIGDRLIYQLARRALELGEQEPANELLSAAKAIRKTGSRWKNIARRWQELPNQHTEPAAGPTIDAGDLLLRLGRLTFDDPAWRPHRNSTCRLVPPEKIAPDLAELRHVAVAALKALETCNGFAQHHRTAVNDIAVLGAVQHHATSEAPFRVSPGMRSLLRAYENVHAAGKSNIIQLSETVERLSPGQAGELALIRKRSALAPSLTHPAAIATTDFPAPLPQIITTNSWRTPAPSTRAANPVAASPKGRLTQ